MAEAVDEILGAGGGDQLLQGFESRTDEGAQCMGLGVHLLLGAGAHEPDEPRSDRRKVVPRSDNGPTGSRSQRGTFRITPGIDIGVTEEPLKQPALPNEAP